MRAMIIGVPCRGKTTLCNKLKEQYPDIRVCNLGHIRNDMGLHTPHQGFDLEVAPQDLGCYYKVLRTLLRHNSENYVMEGYGLGPRKALKMAEQFDMPIVLLAHQETTTAEDDLYKSLQYDAETKWTRRRTHPYLYDLFSFYKTVEQKWVRQMPKDMVFYTDEAFETTIDAAYDYLVAKYEELKVW